MNKYLHVMFYSFIRKLKTFENLNVDAGKSMVKAEVIQKKVIVHCRKLIFYSSHRDFENITLYNKCYPVFNCFVNNKLFYIISKQ